MPSWNQCTVVGHLCRDPERREVGSSSVVSSAVAINRKYTTAGGEKREEVLFLDFSAWGKTGDILNQYSKKGDAILLSGRLRQENWDDKQTGAKRSKISLVVENFQFIGGRKSGDDAAPERQSRGPSQKPAPPTGPPYYEQTIDPDSIPF